MPQFTSEAPISPSGRAQIEPIEARLLFVAERAIKVHQRWLNRIESLQHGIEPILHRCQTPGRRQCLSLLTSGFENICRLRRSIVEIVQRCPDVRSNAAIARSAQPEAVRRWARAIAQSGDIDLPAGRIDVLAEAPFARMIRKRETGFPKRPCAIKTRKSISI